MTTRDTEGRRSGGAQAARTTSLHHPNRPHRGNVRAAHLADDLRDLAWQYLKSVQIAADLSDEVLEMLRGNDNKKPHFGWLPLSWGAGTLAPEARPNPLGSFCVAREVQGKWVDHSVILLAGYRLKDKRPAGGEVGLRVVMHLAPLNNGPDWRVQITGMSTSWLPQDFGTAPAIDAQEERLRDRIADLVASLGYVAAAIEGMAYVDPAADHSLRVFLSCAKPAPDGAAPRNFRLVAELPADGGAARVQAAVERISHAKTWAFTLDPASCPPPKQIELRRATRDSDKLDPLRTATSRIPSRLRRQVSAQGPELEVRQTRLGQVSGKPELVQRIPPTTRPLRSDDLAAAHAYLRGDELMRRLEDYGLMPAQYFKFAKLPLVLRHRAPLKGARDGISVNAQVRPLGVGPGIWPSSGGPSAPPLEVSFGWAELAHRSRLENRGKRLRAQPLGLAADVRWAWHEFAHVLNYASFGELEFRFAHSAGDALAAIVTDPDVCRKGPPEGVPADRFRTFPWVFITRRHDREAAFGWCWCGRRNLARLSLPGADTSSLPHLGYFEEQLLSSSLFRLYRCIGGEDPDLDTRRSASDYCVYLVMRAIQLLGSGTVVPAYKVEDFVEALIDADLGTGVWDIAASWPEAPLPRRVHRVGGCVHKVIRWAFEQQGLYADVADDASFEGPGEAPAVDIYIADRRGDGGSDGDGGYRPVPLSAAPAGTPQWHAADSAIKLDQGELVVTVRNRGKTPATGVQVKCWVLPVGAANADTPALWSPLDAAAGAAPATVGPHAQQPFHFATLVGGTALTGPHWVKAAATCADDPSNLDPLAMPGLNDTDTPLADLVANDNNLGLRVLNF
ncbi:MAG TPA: hypothetical protein PLO41_03185 [Rubrivivax sp.]|nr:hypothetical protein [Rubrivivax sp.]